MMQETRSCTTHNADALLQAISEAIPARQVNAALKTIGVNSLADLDQDGRETFLIEVGVIR